MSWLKVMLIGGASLPLAGCMTAGTNMHGDFACRAPNGTCAPMSTIDARAVASMGAGVRPVGDPAMPGIPNGGRVVTASADGTPPGRTSDRVLRVVFPAHIDAAGIYHDEATAHAVVERAVWTDGLTGGARAAQAVAAVVAAGSGRTSTAAVPDAFPGSKLATMDEIIAARAAHGLVPTSADTSGKPPLPSFKPVALRSPAAIDLREAAAAATAEPVAGLDPNYDTPDVRAIVADDAGPASTGGCVSYRMVRWHGHLHRRAFTRPCTSKPNAAAPIVAYTSVTPPTSPLPLTSSAPATARTTKPASGAATTLTAGSALPLVHFGETDDRAAVAARVRTMAAPALLENSRSSGEHSSMPPPVSKQALAVTGNPFTNAAGSGDSAATATDRP